MIGTSEGSVRRDDQRVPMGTLRTYFSEFVFGRFRASLECDQEEQMTEAHRHIEIARLAYELWERRGRSLGSPEIDWNLAESALGVRDSQEQFSLLKRPLHARRRFLSRILSPAVV